MPTESVDIHEQSKLHFKRSTIDTTLTTSITYSLIEEQKPKQTMT